MPEINKYIILGGEDVASNFSEVQHVEIFNPDTGFVTVGAFNLPESIEGYLGATMITNKHLLISINICLSIYH